MSKETIDDLIPQRVRKQLEKKEEVDLERIRRFLNVNSKDAELKPADVIVVLGTSSMLEEKFEARVKTAIELWNYGLAKRILCTGGIDDEYPTEIPQAVLLKRAIIKGGVPEEAIDVEPAATNTKENITKSRVILERQGAESALFVASQSQGRRVLLYTKKYLNGVEVQVVSADRDLETNPKKPWEEMGKLIAYRHNDDL